jgi:hypothetical protein
VDQGAASQYRVIQKGERKKAKKRNCLADDSHATNTGIKRIKSYFVLARFLKHDKSRSFHRLAFNKSPN